MTPGTALMLFAAGLIAGIVNAIAGGGILFVLPALQLAGIGPMTAAASANVAGFPAHAMAAFTARQNLAALRERFRRSAVIAVVGGLAGACLLLWSGDRLFRNLVPWLVLVATLAFAFGPHLAARLTRIARG